MKNRFVISDTHFGHKNSWEKFKLADGCTPLRPFTSTEEMDETMIERWNEVVGEHDTVYHLGDVVINKRSLELVRRLNGKLRLILGNHDIFKNDQYKDVGFEVLFGCRVFPRQFILTHIPIHPDCIERFRVNVHGHLHANQIMRPDQRTWPAMYDENGFCNMMEPDPRYLCVSVEQTDFRPLHFDEVEERIQKRWKETGYVDPNADWGNGSGPG